MEFELAWDSDARKGCHRQGSEKHKGCSDAKVDDVDAPWKSCTWPAEKPAPDWIPLGLSLFGGLQCPPVDACSIASLDFGAFAGGEQCMFFYSIFLNQKPNSAFILFSYSLSPRLLRKDS